jgi:hypothetical protein
MADSRLMVDTLRSERICPISEGVPSQKGYQPISDRSILPGQIDTPAADSILLRKCLFFNVVRLNST